MAVITSTSENLKNRLGSDLAVPIDGTFGTVSGMELLLQDIQQLLLTIPGERVNRPEYGCNLRNQIWENIDTAASVGAANIRQALVDFEPRITVVDVTSTVNNNTGLILFNIQFVVKSTDVNANLVFPLRAGTALSFA